MHHIRLIFAGLVSFIWLSAAHAQNPAPASDQLQTQAKRMMTYFTSLEYDKMVDMMYPKFVELGGGHEAMVTLSKTTMEQTAKAGFKTEAELGQAGTPVAGGNRLFSVIPQTIRLTGPKAIIEQPGYLLAISADQGKTWTFVGAGKYPPEIFHQLFPDFPATLKLPEQQQPKITRLQ